MKKVSLLKKAISATGSCVRVLIGAGALALLILGIRNKPRKDTKNTGQSR